MSDPSRPLPPRQRGVFGILVSPFASSGDLDTDGLEAQVAFARAAGLAGVVFPGVASEFYALTDDERRRGLERVVAAADNRLTVVAGVTANSTRQAAHFAAHAGRVGAAGVMAMAPSAVRLDGDDLVAFFRAIADAAGTPVTVQSFAPPIGTPLSIAQIARIVRAVPGVRYVKYEIARAPHAVASLVAELGDALDGVFGGVGGLHTVEEFLRGACGTMPAVHLADVLATLWATCEHGDIERARDIHRLLLPAIVRAALLGPRFAKAVLVQRGVIASDATRDGSPPLDAQDRAELDAVLGPLRPLMDASAGARAEPNAGQIKPMEDASTCVS